MVCRGEGTIINLHDYVTSSSQILGLVAQYLQIAQCPGGSAMNHIPNPKTTQINIKIAEIDRAIQEQIFSLQDEEIRKLVDEKRHLSSLLLSMQEPSNSPPKTNQWYDTDPNTQRLLDDWVGKVKNNCDVSLNFDDKKFCEDFVDLAYQAAFENDVIVIVAHRRPRSLKHNHRASGILLFFRFCKKH